MKNKIIVLSFVYLFMFYSLNASEPPLSYMKYIKDAILVFEKDSMKNFNLRPYGSGGTMPYDIEEVIIKFVAYRKGKIEEARMLEVKLTESLLEMINNDPKIRPFLREFPFTPDRTAISVLFFQDNNEFYKDGTVSQVIQVNNQIFFNSDDNDFPCFKELAKESYPEAMRKVMGDDYVPSYVRLKKEKSEKKEEKDKSSES